MIIRAADAVAIWFVSIKFILPMVPLSSTRGSKCTTCTVLRYVVSLGACICLRDGDGVTGIAVRARFGIFLMIKAMSRYSEYPSIWTPFSGSNWEKYVRFCLVIMDNSYYGRFLGNNGGVYINRDITVHGFWSSEVSNSGMSLTLHVASSFLARARVIPSRTWWRHVVMTELATRCLRAFTDFPVNFILTHRRHKENFAFIFLRCLN